MSFQSILVSVTLSGSNKDTGWTLQCWPAECWPAPGLWSLFVLPGGVGPPCCVDRDVVGSLLSGIFMSVSHMLTSFPRVFAAGVGGHQVRKRVSASRFPPQ